MKALRYYARGDIRVDEVEEPQVAPGMLKVETGWCGICGSDLHEYLGGPLEQAAMVEPFAVGLHAVKHARVQPGDSAVVFGAGPIGLMTIVALRAYGAETIVVSEPSEGRRAAATQAGADHVVDPRATD